MSSPRKKAIALDVSTAPPEESTMPDFDSAWKEALEIFFEPFMAFFFPDAHRDIDWARDITMLDKELAEITRESEHGRRVDFAKRM